MKTKQNSNTPVRPKTGLLTRQRKLVLQVLNDTADHLDAGMVFQKARKMDDRISLATVYRSLDYLKKQGLIEENSFGEDHAHFEAAPETQHYHFTCLSCGKVIEMDAAEMLKMVRRLGCEQNLEVAEMHLYVRGYCSSCRGKNQPISS
jgi:Fe2+ or Zn2+ uptake regulation protein